MTLPERRTFAVVAALSLAVWAWLYWALRTGADNLNLVVPLSVALRPIGAAATALLVMLPLEAARRLTSQPALRAVLRAWQWAAGLMLLLVPAYLGPLENDQLTALLDLAGLLAYLALLRWAPRREGTVPAAGRAWWPVGLAPLLAWPWLAVGALGSPLDAALNLATGLLLGLAAATLLEQRLLPALRAAQAPARTTALAAATTLALLAASLRFEYFVLNLLLLVAMLPLGALAARLAGERPAGPALAWVIGLTAAAPMLLLDPEELFGRGHLIHRGAPDWTTLAAWAAALLTLGVAALWPLWKRLAAQRAGALALVLATMPLAAAVYVGVGHPGFHGEHLFVVMATTADLSPAADLTPVGARRAWVYATLSQTARDTQRDTRAFLDRWGVPYTPYYLVNGLDLTADPWLGWWLRARYGAARALVVTVDRPAPPGLPAVVERGTAALPATPLPNLALIGADRVWRELGITGTGIVIGAIDGGVQADHPELAASYRGRDDANGYGWFDPENGAPAPSATGAHGTHALAVAVGQQVGVAPGAEWMFCRLGRTIAQRLGCLQWLLAPYPPGADAFTAGDPALGADISTNSWECAACDGALLRPAAEALRAAGIFVVAGAGNYGPGCNTVPHPIAHLGEIFTVGAVRDDGELITWSSRGPVVSDGSGRPKPDLVAPGALVLSATPGSAYEYFSGTSFSAPHVAGVVALLWSANPALRGDVARTTALLTATARPLPSDDPACPGGGAGLVDAYAAVSAALAER